MVNHKGFVKTFGMAIAIIFVGAFVLFIIPAVRNRSSQERNPEDVLQDLKYDGDFLDCLENPDALCINSTVGKSLGPGLDYAILITSDPEEDINNPKTGLVFSSEQDFSELPKKRVFSESLMSEQRIIRAYYWYKDG